MLTYSFLCRSSALWPLYKALSLGSASITIDGPRRLSNAEQLSVQYRAWISFRNRLRRVLLAVVFPFPVSVCSRLAHGWLTVGPRWNVATLVFPDGGARLACVRVSSSVSARRELRGERW